MTNELTLMVPASIIEQALSGDTTPLRDLFELRTSKTKAAAARALLEADIQRVFDRHKELFWNGHGPEPRLIPTKHRIIKRALTTEGYSVEDLLAILEAARRDKWYMGDNPEKRKYTGIESIFRWDGRMERFLSRNRDMQGESNTRKEREKCEEVQLQLHDLATKMRDGTATLADKEALMRLTSEHRARTGEQFDWHTSEFALP